MRRVIPRWRAAIAAGVDFIATDQYEALSGYLDQRDHALRPEPSDQRKATLGP
jgi:hypothetical protein